MAEKSVRGNMLPPGGATVTTDAGQGQSLLPSTLQLKQYTEVFMERSEQNCVVLNQVDLEPGQKTSFKIRNVGLGESLELIIEGEVAFKNESADTDAVVRLAPEFPFNIISNILTQFNGQTVINSLSGYELLAIMAKREKGVILGAAASVGSEEVGQDRARVDHSIAWIKGSTYAVVHAGNGLTGVDYVTVTKAKTGTVTFGCYLKLPYTLRSDILLGLIPMQNNSVSCDVDITVPTLFGTTPNYPFYMDEIPATLTIDSYDVTASPTFNFWAIPMPNDAKLYSYLVSHSYMLLSQQNNALNNTGVEGLQHLLPNNYYLMALLFTMRDSGKALLNVPAVIDYPYLSYNGTARVDRRSMKTKIARETIYCEGIPTLKGMLLHDLTWLIDYFPNGTLTSRWLNMYLANNPQFVADIAATVSTPGTYSVLREQLVPANVQIV